MIDAVTSWRIISDSSKVFYKIPMKQDNEIKICMTIVLFIGNEKRYHCENKRYHNRYIHLSGKLFLRYIQLFSFG